MKTNKQMTGDYAENIVMQILQQKGLSLLAKNYSVPGLGELDLVFQKGDVIYIVEVRSRKVSQHPEEESFFPFDPKKVLRLRSTSQYFLKDQKLSDKDIRLLGAWVLHDVQGKIKGIRFLSLTE